MLAESGIDYEALTMEQLASFDQLHFGGSDGTRALGEFAGLKKGMEVLDVGSGVGGPARTLAHEFGCRVVGVDLTREFVEAANELTARVNLEDMVEFEVGNASDLPVESEAFDVVWMQNSIMNIKDKQGALREANRVLRPGGILVLEAILAGPNGGLVYPVFWAETAEISFLARPDEVKRLADLAGFIETKWLDITPEVIEASRKMRDTPPGESAPLGIGVVYDNVPLKGKNTTRGFEQGQILNVYAVFEKPGRGT